VPVCFFSLRELRLRGEDGLFEFIELSVLIQNEFLICYCSLWGETRRGVYGDEEEEFLSDLGFTER
jgi:hypothetical protein